MYNEDGEAFLGAKNQGGDEEDRDEESDEASDEEGHFTDAFDCASDGEDTRRKLLEVMNLFVTRLLGSASPELSEVEPSKQRKMVHEDNLQH